MTKMLSVSAGLRPLTRGSAPGPRWGLRPQTPVIGSCSTLAMVPSQPLTSSAAYGPREKILWGGPAIAQACRQEMQWGGAFFVKKWTFTTKWNELESHFT